MSISYDHLLASSSHPRHPQQDPDAVLRTRSVIGQKRSRPSDTSSTASPAPRRSKSVSDARELLLMPASGPDGAGGKEKGKGRAPPGGEGEWKKGMFVSFVKKALVDKENGIPDTYLELLSQLRPSPSVSFTLDPTPAPLKTSLLLPLLTALTANASLLSSAHTTLIEAILALPWTTADEGFVRVYTGMIGVVVSLRMEWIGEVVKMLVKGFRFQSGLRPLFDTSSSSPLTRGLVYTRIHTLLAHLLNLIPTLPSIVQPILIHNFPHKREPKIHHVTYIRNALRVLDYCPALGDKVLSSVVDRAIQIDVEIQVEWEDFDDDSDNEDALSEGSIFDGDPFDKALDAEDDEGPLDDEEMLSDDASSEEDEIINDVDVFSDDEDEEARQKKKKTIKDMVAKLDVILNTVLEHFNKLEEGSSSSSSANSSSTTLTNSSSFATSLASSATLPSTPFTFPAPSIPTLTTNNLSSASLLALRTSQFSTLLSIFDRLILKTFKSRYTQFLLFYYTSLSPTFTDEFQSLLLSKALFERDQPDIARIAAASYIASFVSRARWVPKETVRNVMGLLCKYLEAQLEAARMKPEILRGVGGVKGQGGFGVFFAVAQAVFLIFCFRWKDLVVSGGGEEGGEGEGEGEGLITDGEMEGMGMSGGGGTGGSQREWAEGLEVLDKVVSSAFNPLKVCSPNVVKQFARVANHTSFLYVYHIIQANNRSSSSSSHNTTNSPLPTPSTTHNPSSTFPFTAKNLPAPSTKDRPSAGNLAMNEADLDSFFPFDPFKLPLSARFIDGIYRNWEALPGDEDSESDEDDEEEEEEEEEQEADEGDESMDTFPGPTSYEDSGFHIPGTAAGGRRRGKGKNRRGSGGLTVSSSQEDSEVDMLGRSLDQAMSISPAMGLVGRMGVAAPGGGGEKSVRWN